MGRSMSEMSTIEKKACEYANLFHDKKTNYKDWLSAKILFKDGYKEALKLKKILPKNNNSSIVHIRPKPVKRQDKEGIIHI